ncbi:hypothetical protein CC85DRAFT_83380 [Cutaneotrichosporon oleaginosum]|uniref:Uncharacterized protein n=1 Tax=Cutaneotrichosporon oleaginosum TaxID=879819 RepID=A0A0J1B4G2_9TREE|nr:uncharacterized protein CC85DRAFT_83380 [Cutaneotrichosporon oleaginosum]KLT42544.1 hypothetical protein CC85DRAFT_83380 [Cutaneotrichosporon oleaginosum]TXT15039.1 hypothetical protein COLE_01232 [Cutaneotrichosporon oleaginosum]
MPSARGQKTAFSDSPNLLIRAGRPNGQTRQNQHRSSRTDRTDRPWQAPLGAWSWLRIWTTGLDAPFSPPMSPYGSRRGAIPRAEAQRTAGRGPESQRSDLGFLGSFASARAARPFSPPATAARNSALARPTTRPSPPSSSAPTLYLVRNSSALASQALAPPPRTSPFLHYGDGPVSVWSDAPCYTVRWRVGGKMSSESWSSASKQRM